MSEGDGDQLMARLSEVMSTFEWDRLDEVFHPDAVVEYPQSGEVFRGLENIRAQFENYPGLEEDSSSRLEEVIGGPTYALTPTYTLIEVKGTGQRRTGVVRVRYPDGTWWWVLNLYEVRDDRVWRSRSYFAPDFDAPDWRAPYREAP
ncbi:MAG TPA: nuclear transport factor 2 family protein [Gemmatimonadaceae bacterium]|nr:nuclear transport factor 2 family protein [Gemmatimonadaceae bacterium]